MNKKFFLTAAGITIFILILVLVLSPKRNSSPPPSGSAETKLSRVELIDLSQDKRNQAMIYVESIEKKLPIYLEKFETSVGITTSINLYRVKDDEAEIVRLEIYGLSYLNSESDPKKNPNVTAFKESYLKAIEMLEGQNIDPKKLIFIYGDKQYVRETAQAWADALKLHP
jgi:hypothetical protein